MEQFELISRFAGQFHSFSVFLQKYGTLLTAAGLIFSLLNCFLGYRLRKLWNLIVGFLAGMTAGMALCLHFHFSPRWSLPASLGAGFVCAVLAFLLYRLGLFILCSGLTAFLLFQLIHPGSIAGAAVCLAAGIAAGILALARERVTVSLVTSIGGGFGSSTFLFSLLGLDNPILTLLVTAVLAFLGILVQLQPWRPRDYWEEEDQTLKRERKNQSRLRSQRRKNRKKQKRKEKKAKKKAKSRENRNRTPKQQKQTSSRPQSKPASSQASTSRPASQAPVSSPADAPVRPTEPETAGAAKEEPSFSDIQLQLAKEISQIYEKQQTPEDPPAPKEP